MQNHSVSHSQFPVISKTKQIHTLKLYRNYVTPRSKRQSKSHLSTAVKAYLASRIGRNMFKQSQIRDGHPCSNALLLFLLFFPHKHITGSQTFQTEVPCYLNRQQYTNQESRKENCPDFLLSTIRLVYFLSPIPAVAKECSAGKKNLQRNLMLKTMNLCRI